MLKGFVRAREKFPIELTDEERYFCDILTGEPLHIDELLTVEGTLLVVLEGPLITPYP
jgi:hypothetical protein